jgi:hypothetical protein
MADEHADPEIDNETLARHRDMVDVFEGRRPMDWSIWAMFIEDSICLTSDGRRVAHWAVKMLQGALGDDFLANVQAKMKTQRTLEGLEPCLHPVFSLGFLPANDVPWVYANLMQMALQFALFQRDLSTNHFGRVLRNLRSNLQSSVWVSALLQMEVAGLGLQAGWTIQFEPSLGNKHLADVCLTHHSSRLLVESTSMRISDEERKTLTFYERLGWQLTNLEWQYNVRIAGFLGWSRVEEEMKLWFQKIAAMAQATGQDGIIRQVAGPNEGLLTIFRPTEATAGEPWGISSPTVEARILERVVARLQDKQERQAKGSAIPVWVRLDEYAGLWQATRFQNMPLEELLKALAPFFQQKLAAYPDLAGIIVAPAVLWNGGIALEEQRVQFEQHGARAIRCPIAGNRLRETIIIPQAGLSQAEQEAQMFADWYAHEDTWLDWALAQFGHPSFERLVQD